MPIKEFIISDLREIDGGRISEALKLQLKRVIEDCRDRPNLDKPRKIKLQIEISPTADPKTFALDGINLSFRLNSTYPNMERVDLNLGCKANGQLFFSEHSPDNFDQKTVFDDEKE